MSKLDAALEYAELGYQVFPCVPNEKRPLTKNGLLDATTEREQVDAWWTQWPDANVAIVTNGLVVIDLDVDDRGEANQWLFDEPEKLMDLAIGPLSLTPRGGRHYIFRQPAGQKLRNTASQIAPHVDTRADGGYILVPPSIVNGACYRWGGDCRLDVAISSLPEPPAWLLPALIGNGQVGPAPRTAPVASNDIPSGQRNQALTRIGGGMRRMGLSQAEIAAGLRKINIDRCKPPLDLDEVDKIAWSVARYEPDGITVAYSEDHAGQDAGIEPDDRPKDPGTFPVHLLEVPGFLGEVSRFSVETATSPQPILALAAALPLLGTLTGRKVRDQYGTRTNIYVLGVCASGRGKERAREVNKDILHQAGLDRLIGNESAASSTGLVNAVARNPSILFQWDEIGRLLKTMGDARSPHTYHIQTVLMRLFSSSRSVFISDAFADAERNLTIYQPNACLYGTTVPKSLYEGLTADAITDGFLSRLLILETSHDPNDNIYAEPLPPTASILEVARFWGDFKPGGNMSNEIPQPAVVPYTNDAIAAVSDLQDLVQGERRLAIEPYNTLWTRVIEKARKLALLFACSERHKDPVIDVPAIQWAAELAVYLTRRMAYLADSWVAENRHESASKRIERLLTAEGMTMSQLTRRTRWLTARERNEIIDGLCLAGIAVVESVLTHGRPSRIIRKV